MRQLRDYVQYAIKSPVHDDGLQWVQIEHDGKRYSRRIKYKPFSNWPVEYVKWNNGHYQVNNIAELYPTEDA